jgi:hypothetical protein
VGIVLTPCSCRRCPDCRLKHKAEQQVSLQRIADRKERELIRAFGPQLRLSCQILEAYAMVAA